MPSAEAVQLVLAAVPGVDHAEVESRGEAQGTLRIRVAEGFDPRAVAEQVSAVLRQRFSIEIPPEALIHEPPAKPSPAGQTPAAGEDEPVILHDASRLQQPETEVVGVDLPGWDTVLVRAQESAARVASSAAAATATRAIRTGPAIEFSTVPTLAAVPEPFDEGPVHDVMAKARLTIESLPSQEATKGIRVVDASVDGVGKGRRAIVVISRPANGEDRMAIGAALVAERNDATAVANATLAAIRDLD